MSAAAAVEAPVRGLHALVDWMSPRRKRQLLLLLILMLIGAIAELLAIGTVLPFLRLIVAPQALLDEPQLAGMRRAMGWRTPDDLIVPAALLLITCAVGAAGIRLLLTWASQRFIYRLGHDMDVELFQRTVRQPYLAYVAANGSEVLAGFDKINALTNMLLLPAMQGIAAAVIASFVIAFLLWIAPLAAGATAIGAGLVYVGIATLSRRPLRQASEERARLATTRIKAVRDGLGALRDIILDRSQPIHERRFAAMNDAFRNAGARTAIIAAAPRYVMEAGGVTLIGLAAIYLTTRSGGMLAGIPTLGVLALGMQRLLPLLQASYQGLVQYLAMRHSLANVLDLMARPMIDPPLLGYETSGSFDREIRLTNIGFHYPDRSAVLSGITLRIARGERIGLVGQTGSGKSTLIDLIMGLLPPDVGSISIDGEALTEDRISSWQAHIAHVPQSVFLIDASIAENIAFAADEGTIDMVAVEAAARRAHIHDDVVRMPDNYATRIGERGIRLSGGQRQRIGIARALYKRADVLILDEATSALDDATEAGVMAAINALGSDLTVIMIAHRLSTLAGCDLIYRLDGGRIVAQGGYHAIITDGMEAS
jgi:ABC-type multidrug transport system fused ATPase/permease subunit